MVSVSFANTFNSYSGLLSISGSFAFFWSLVQPKNIIAKNSNNFEIFSYVKICVSVLFLT